MHDYFRNDWYLSGSGVQGLLARQAKVAMYQADPKSPPDDSFAAGELRWLVPGNRGRLLDGRRTPVRVSAVDVPHGYFEVEILAFEDKGARWLVPLEEVTHYQFAPGGARASVALVASMEDVIRRLDVTAEIAADQEARRQSERKIAAERTRADWCISG